MACGIRQEPRGLGTVVLTAVSTPADSTGTHSLYTTYQDYEIMFHVSTLLPYTPNNRQQVSGPQWGTVSVHLPSSRLVATSQAICPVMALLGWSCESDRGLGDPLHHSHFPGNSRLLM